MTMRLYVAIAVAFGIAGLLAFPGAMGFRLRTIRLKLADFMIFAAMAAIGIIGYGDKFSPTNNPPNGLSQPMMMMFNPQPAGPTVTETDVARGFSVMSVGTNEVFDFTMPTDGVRVAKWWLRGGSNDKAFVPGGIAMIRGEILDSLPRPSVRYCPLKATSLLAAGESEFWHQQTASNSTVYTWKDAYLWRNLSLPFSMQAEIFENGDFEYRYDLSRISDMDALTNVVVGAKFGTNQLGDVSWLLDGTNTVTSIRFQRISEFDWDGDGLANDIDPDPYTNNGDCHGQGEGWVLASFTNSAEIISAGGYTNWVASTIANDADCIRYSFTVTVDKFDATGHSCVSIDGKSVVLSRDAPSATFLLLRGKRYPFSVTPAGTQFSSIALDNAQPVVEYDSSIGLGFVTMSLNIDLAPSEIILRPITGYSQMAVFRIATPGLFLVEEGTTWSSEHGYLTIVDFHDNAVVSWNGPPGEYYDTLYCDTSFGWYTNRQSVVVRYDPDPEEAPHVILQSPDTVFVNDDDDAHAGTNDFENAAFDTSVADDDIVPVVVGFKSLTHPTNGTLRLSAQGLRIWENQNHIGTPVSSITMTNCATPYERAFYVERDSLQHSSVDGCRLSLEWLEREDDTLGCATNLVTAAKPVLRPVCNDTYAENGTNYLFNPCCVVNNGPAARFQLYCLPSDYPAQKIVWSCTNPRICFPSGGTGMVVRVSLQNGVENVADTSWLNVAFGSCPSASPRFGFATVNPRVVKLYPHIVTENKSIVTQRMIDNEVEYANTVFSQVGVAFVCQPVVTIKHGDLSKIDKHNRTKVDSLYSLSKHSDGVDVYYVDAITQRRVAGFSMRGGNKIVIGPRATLSTLAHELGHSFGMFDIYDWCEKKNGASIVRQEVDGIATADMFSLCDWNGGTGTRYYENDLKTSIIQTFLMYGCRSESKMDIPLESVDGLIRDDSAPSGGRPSWAAIGFRGHQMHGITQ